MWRLTAREKKGNNVIKFIKGCQTLLVKLCCIPTAFVALRCCIVIYPANGDFEANLLGYPKLIWIECNKSWCALFKIAWTMGYKHNSIAAKHKNHVKISNKYKNWLPKSTSIWSIDYSINTSLQQQKNPIIIDCIRLNCGFNGIKAISIFFAFPIGIWIFDLFRSLNFLNEEA